MTSEEIVRDYRLSKTPMKQIGILAELNGCSKREIVDVLRGAGVELPKQYQKKPEKEVEQEIPLASVIDAATVRKEIDDLNDKLDDLNDKLEAMKLKNRMLEIKINEVIDVLQENMEAAELRDIIVNMCAKIYGEDRRSDRL